MCPHTQRWLAINANPASDPALIATVADLRSDAIVIEDIDIRYPEASLTQFAFADTPIRVRDGRVEIPVRTH